MRRTRLSSGIGSAPTTKGLAGDEKLREARDLLNKGTIQPFKSWFKSCCTFLRFWAWDALIELGFTSLTSSACPSPTYSAGPAMVSAVTSVSRLMGLSDLVSTCRDPGPLHRGTLGWNRVSELLGATLTPRLARTRRLMARSRSLASGWWRIAFFSASQGRPAHCVNKHEIFHIPLLSELKSPKTVGKACYRKINLSISGNS